jgi:hypothetical protein
LIPDVPAGIDETAQSIHHLFPKLWIEADDKANERFIFLHNSRLDDLVGGQQLIRQKLPTFGQNDTVSR